VLFLTGRNSKTVKSLNYSLKPLWSNFASNFTVL
jgi:hypothetical protein